MAGDPWTDTQNDLIVADYFAMLADDLAERRYSKAGHNRALQDRIGRGRGSIEYKHQNISAVLQWLGQPWIPGYKPALNFQGSLIEAVVRWLDHRPDYMSPMQPLSSAIGPETPGELFVGPPPTASDRQQRAAAEGTRSHAGGRSEIRCGGAG